MKKNRKVSQSAGNQKSSQTNVSKVLHLLNNPQNIDISDIPELSSSEWENALVEYPEAQEKSARITMRVQPRVKKYFQSKYKNYTSVIHKILEKQMKEELNHA